MNAPLAAPALKASRPSIAIVGAGPGGLAAAMLLAAQGARVTVFEKDSVVGGRTRTLEEVGKEFNVTRERIRQIEAKALRKLRHPSRSKKLKDFLN